MKYHYYIADAFTSEPFNGAQIAVFTDTDGLSADDMQKMARELNLSESIFVLPADRDGCDARLEIYSPTHSVPAGAHTIVAAAFVLATTGKIALTAEHTPCRLQNQGRTIDAHISDKDGKPGLIQFSCEVTPTIDRFVPLASDMAEILSLTEADLQVNRWQSLLVAQDAPYLIVPVRNLAALNRALFDYRAWSASTAPATMVRDILLVSEQAESPAADFRARLLGPQIGIHDDPPIGPALPALAGYLCAHEHIRYGTHVFTVERGSDSTRKSLLHMEMDKKKHAATAIRVGGNAVMVGEGVLYQHVAA